MCDLEVSILFKNIDKKKRAENDEDIDMEVKIRKVLDDKEL